MATAHRDCSDPKRDEWSVLEQITSVVWTLVDVDWQGNFKSFFEVVRVQIRCKDHTKIPTSKILGVGTKLFKISIAVEPPTEENLSDDLLEDRTNKETNTETNNDTPAPAGQNGGGTSKVNTASGSNNTGKSSGSQQHTKQTAMAFLQNLQDPELEAHSYQLLQAMEMEDDEEEEIFNNIEEDCVEAFDGEGEQVIFSHCPIINEDKMSDPVQHVKNWGPVQAQRKSSRVDVGERIVLEIAVNKKKMLNLEMEKHGYKDMVADTFDSQKVDDPFQRVPLRRTEVAFSKDSDDSHLPFLVDSGVIDGKNTAGVLSLDSLSKMSLGKGGGTAGMMPTDRYTPPSSSEKTCKYSSLLSPVTPLELPLSPIQSFKRIKSGRYREPGEQAGVQSNVDMLVGA